MKALMSVSAVLFLALLSGFSCRESPNSPKQTGPTDSPDQKREPIIDTSNDKMTSLQRLENALASCAPPQLSLDGIAVIYDLSETSQIKPTCLTVTNEQDTFLTTQGCSLPEETQDIFISSFQDGKWQHRPVIEKRKAPFILLHGWMSSVGSLDLTVLRAEPTKVHMPSKIGSVPWTQRRHNLQFLSLQEGQGACPLLAQEEVKEFPYIYEWGSPLQLAQELYSPEIFLGEGSMSCAATKPGTILSVIGPRGAGKQIHHVGIYSRSAKFYEKTCGERSEEIFLNLQSAQRWQRSVP